MAALVIGLLILAMVGHSSAAFCACRPNVGDTLLQSAIDYACGAGADCNPIRPNGQCYNPNTLLNHCTYAVNSYYQRKASSGATCDFSGAATLTNSPPSGGCSYSGSPSTGTGIGGPTTTVPTTAPPTTGGTPSTNPVTPVPGTGTGTGTGTGIGTGIGVTPTTPTGGSPYSTTPTPGGMLGGGIGIAPTGTSMDDSGAIKLNTISFGSILAMLVTVGIMH